MERRKNGVNLFMETEFDKLLIFSFEEHLDFIILFNLTFPEISR